MEKIMKRLSALVIGAFMLVSANSVMALEGPSVGDPTLQPANSAAIAAVRQLVKEVKAENERNQCFEVPVSLDGQGISLENVCVNINAGDNDIARNDYPEIVNPQN